MTSIKQTVAAWCDSILKTNSAGFYQSLSFQATICYSLLLLTPFRTYHRRLANRTFECLTPLRQHFRLIKSKSRSTFLPAAAKGSRGEYSKVRRETIAVHGGYEVDPTTRAVAVPIYQTAAYAFDSAEHGAALFNLEVPGHRYTRISNPTTDVLEQRITELEGGIGALSVSSGQAALYYAAMNALQMGCNIVSVPQLYGTTYTLFAHILPNMGIGVRFAKSDRAADLESLIDDNTRAIFCETVGNPAGNVCDLEALAAVAHRHRMPLIVDNTVATPMLVRPVEYGADVVVHSLTKFMGGHGTTLGGIIVDCGRFPWQDHAARYPMFTQPDESYHGLIYTQHFGASAFIGRCRCVYQRTVGAVLSPLSAFLLLQGIETVALRIDRHVENARQVAAF